MRSLLLGLIGLLCLSVSTPVKAVYNAGDIHDEEELAGVILQLDDPGTERVALGRLLRFAGIFLGEGSISFVTEDPAMDNLRRKAVRTIEAHWSQDSVQRALYDDDEIIRLWGVQTFESSFGKREPWKFLLPRLQEIAAHDRSVEARRSAIEKLGYYEESAAFLAALRDSPAENDPRVLMTLLRFDSQNPERCTKWYERAVKFLSDPDEAVRWRWLSEIAFNALNLGTARMWQIGPDPALVEALRQIEQTGSPKEQDLAGKTLHDLQARGQASEQGSGKE